MGIERIQKAFQNAPATPAFVAFLTAGFPRPEVTVECLLALQKAGADVIEVGVPFSDPLADGATIQHASTVALQKGMSLRRTLDMVSEARARGLSVPVVLMGYFNPFLAFGFDKFAEAAQQSGVDGVIIVDLPPEEARTAVLPALLAHDLSFVPLVAPTSTPARIAHVCAVASSFVYCVSVTGVTGSRSAVSGDLPALLSTIREHTSLPIAVGFGVSTKDHVAAVGDAGADGVVVGSTIISALSSLPDDATPQQCAQAVEGVVSELVKGRHPGHATPHPHTLNPTQPQSAADLFSQGAKFGEFGGCYVPETLVEAHKQLWEEFNKAIADPAFVAEMHRLRENYIGGPTPLYFAERLTTQLGGARVWFKREELAHTGAHKINNALGQALLVKRMGKSRVIAETGAGQHGVATATACALLGLQCVVYMGAEDCRRQSLNVFKMKMLGATVTPVTSGTQTLKDAINEAMRDWVTNVRTTHYIVGSAIGPHPFPSIVRHFQSVIGNEARKQFLEANNGTLPDVVVACVGGGSNAIGMFSAFVNDPADKVKIVGVEAGGKEGISGLHSATLTAGKPGVLHGTFTFLQQDADGQIEETHSISAGLDYPGVGPEHSFLKVSGRAEYVCVTDSQALDALQLVSQTEGIIPALEPSHALAHAIVLAKQMGPTQNILVNVCGRGDKDMITVAKALGHSLGVDVKM
jgi:tryptophan synthase